MAAGVDGTGPAPGLPAITSGLIHPSAPHAGTHFVQGSDRGRRFDDTHGTGWRLVVLDTGPDQIGPQEQVWFESIGGRVVALPDPAPQCTRWVAEPAPPCALQRPAFSLHGTSPAESAARRVGKGERT